jgi:hypothetical protein
MKSTRYSCQNLNLNFVEKFSNNQQISNFVEILSVGAVLFRANRRTERQTYDKVNSRFFFSILRTRLKMVLLTRYLGCLYSDTNSISPKPWLCFVENFEGKIKCDILGSKLNECYQRRRVFFFQFVSKT